MNGKNRASTRKSNQVAARCERRGNAIILVIGILVLLVIIATAYVSRTDAGRQSSSAIPKSELREDTHMVFAQGVANDIALALFPHPIDTSVAPALNLTGFPATPNRRRLPVPANAERYSSDIQDFNNDGIPEFVAFYNTPPYQVVPFTNPPDAFLPPGNPALHTRRTKLPRGPGNPDGGTFSSLLESEWNPMGGPGFGDCRWLRDLEPQRGYTDWPILPNNNFPANLGPDVFTHWKHLTYIGRPDNAFRICTDISDIGNAILQPGDPNGFPLGVLVTDLEIPVEQWMSFRPFEVSVDGPSPNNAFLISGHHMLPANFMGGWAHWFGLSNGLVEHLDAAVHPAGQPGSTPNNLYKLNDLDGDGFFEEIGEQPPDEFTPGTARWTVSRVLADSDGDGFTDSFWWLAPSTMDSSTRQIIAISIVDNQSMLNVNVATRYKKDDSGTAVGAKATRGLTPTDLALVGNLDGGTLSSNWNVGFYDNPEHHYWPTGGNSYDFTSRFDYTVGRWNEHLVETGLSIDNASKDTLFQRLRYWRAAASNPLSSDPTTEYTPFTLADEIELRMFYGNNYPFVYSRYESSVQGANALESSRFLRATINESPAFARVESSEYEQQLTSRQLLKDQRHRLTVHNSVRNDIMPPWLWRWPIGEDFDLDGSIDGLDRDFNGDGTPNFNGNPVVPSDKAFYEAGQRKTDLRIAGDATVVGNFYSFLPSGAADPTNTHLEFAPVRALSVVNTVNGENRQVWTYLNLGKSWRDQIIRAVSESPNLPMDQRSSYYGKGATNLARTYRMAAGLAANMLQVHDPDYQSPLVESMPIPPVPGGGVPLQRVMGMEAQPFLVEAFIAHVYNDSTAVLVTPQYDPNGNAYTNFGHMVLVEPPPPDPDHPVDPNPKSRGSIVVVQLANPFDRVIDLSNYELSVFGQRVALIGNLLPATDEGVVEGGVKRAPTTAIFYAVADNLKNDANNTLRRKWLDFLDLDMTNATGNAISQTSVIRDVKQLVTIPPPPPPPPTGGGPTGGIAQAGPPIGGGPPPPTDWSTERTPYDTNTDGIKLYRKDYLTDTPVLVDRFDPPGDNDFVAAVNNMGTPGLRPPTMVEIGGAPGAAVISPGEGYGQALGAKDLGFPTQRFKHWVQWVRVTRAWGFDVNNNGKYEPNEKNPRYIFADRAVIESAESSGATTQWEKGGNRYRFTDPPDGDSGPGDPVVPSPSWGRSWFTRDCQRLKKSTTFPAVIQVGKASRKPTYFNMAFNAPVSDPFYIPSFPDKGWCGQPDGVDQIPVELIANPGGPPTLEDHTNLKFPLRMLQKDGDFEQIGEIMNVWLYGHLIRVVDPAPQASTALVEPPKYVETSKTFSEFMSEEAEEKEDIFVNRLRAIPAGDVGQIIGALPLTTHTPYNDSRYAGTALPAAVRLMDAFVCDGPGLYGKYGLDDLHNAKGFDGTGTPGMINVNTAPLEVMRALPNWYRAVHPFGDMASLIQGESAIPLFNASGQPLVTNGTDTDALLPRTMLPEAWVAYREQYTGGPVDGTDTAGISFGPNYQNRPNALGGSGNLRGERGISSIGEGLLLTRQGAAQWDRQTAWEADDLENRFDHIYEQYWTSDLGATAKPGYFYNQGANQIESTAVDSKKPFWYVDGSNQVQAAMRLTTNQNGWRDTNHNDVPDYVDVWQDYFSDLQDTTPPPLGPLQIKDGLLDTQNEPTRRLAEHISSGPAAGSWVGSSTTAGDSSEFNALFSGASNMLTTRSDTFTVYFRVRSFRQNTTKVPAVWDATDPNYIVDDSRYVMLVDRSMVNKPGDKPRILYLEKIPN